MNLERQILNKAADLIEYNGFCKETYSNGNGYCALGAIREAAQMVLGLDMYGSGFFAPAQMKGGAEVSYWNDKPERTKKDVVKMLRRAARSA